MSSGSRPARAAAVALLLLATAAAYAGRLAGPFVFDDHGAIERNRTIRSLWPLPGALAPPGAGHPLSGRPVANLSLALGYAVCGADPRGFRLGSLLLHASSALLLLGGLRRTLRSRRVPARLRRASGGIAFATALLWAVHPLCSEVVLYATQRTEACLGSFVFLTFYAAIRATGSAGRAARGWGALAVAACALGMGSKETMALTPPLVLLWDRAFGAGSLRAAWTRHGALHGALFATLALLALLALQTPRGRAAYLWDPDYLLAQGEVVRGYLGRALWPRELVFDYGPLLRGSVAPGPADALLLLALFAAAALAWAAPRAGYPAAFALLLLAPTSSLVAMPPEVGAERRMYLPLAGLLALLATGVHLAGGAALRRLGLAGAARRAIALGTALLLAAGLAARTRARAEDYASELGLWERTARARPGNLRAHYMVGNLRREAGDLAAARAAFERSLAVAETAPALTNLGALLAADGDRDGARRRFERALELDPRSLEARANLGILLLDGGAAAEALPHLERAVRRAPQRSALRLELARALAATGERERARQQLLHRLRESPGDPQARRLLRALRDPPHQGVD